MGRTAVGIIESHIRDLAEHLRALETLRPQAQEQPPRSQSASKPFGFRLLLVPGSPKRSRSIPENHWF